MYVRINSTMYFDTEFQVTYNHKKTLPHIVMQKTYFVDFGWAEA